MTLRSKLLSSGVGEGEVNAIVLRNIYPLPHRIWWRLRRQLGFDFYTAEWTLLNDLGNARCQGDVEEALLYYHHQRPQTKALFMKPRRHRVIAYFKQVIQQEPG